ncbi:DNA-directed DNA polymerase [Kluyveromyces lactis]|uniref:KLLA0D00792p n=1 Tax=Kluyveromyces lactis (strain ATCC 8585 / CBS 2359 / DSM 70799 / NBRC 1267 / NRRL Y-1140 / WM37) TaxID=284590 RepID=Q6CSI2_KLULA|nr:uncharacterized protein KLLA0_D00792g [Kluyveromyces lactis]CAH00203.1 KLLA0D00792p [Kluyveromyces lactis]|eukprot:XP_453107.1 uncharacterized protein KLLA0_D00792g [Kluyveromyces lactis]
MKEDQVVSRVNRDLFFKVASELEKERLEAAIQLINEISRVDTRESEDGVREWEYVIGRLVKGLASNRGGARLGFSMCLTEVIALALERRDILPSIYAFLNQLEQTLPAGTAFKNGKEERGVLFGQMFALQSLLNEPVFSKLFLSTDDNSINMEFLLTYLNKLIQLALSKTWLREPCLYSVYQTIQKCETRLFNDPTAINLILGLLDEKKLTLTNEGLSIYLMFNAQRDTYSSSLVIHNSGWKNNDPLSKGNVQLLASVLKDVVPVEKSDLKQKGTWAPRLHYVWDILLPLLEDDGSFGQSMESHISKKRKKNTASMSSERTGRIQFPDFWQAVVDESFFNEKSSNERKYLGFLILEEAIKVCSPKLIQVLLSQNLLRCIINQSQDSQRMLNKISTQALKSIVAECERSPAKVVPLVEVFWFGRNGSINFDKLIKSKLVNSLISTSSLEKEHLVDLVNLLISQLPQDQSTKDSFNLTRFIFDTFLHITRAHKTRLESHWVKPLLSAIIKAAFFNESDNSKLSELAKERLYSILGELISEPSKSSGDISTWPYIALQIILKIEGSGSTLSIDLDEDLESVRKSAIKSLKQNHSDNKNNTNPKLNGLELLLSVAILQLYAGDEESVSILQDLISFYEECDKESTDLVGITEILLSLVAQRKSLLKKLSLIVWESFVHDIGEPELNVLLQTLTARENKQGFADLFEGDEEEDDEDAVERGTDDDDDEDDEDNDDDDEPSAEDSEDDVSEEDKDAALEKIEKEATSALAKALNLPDSIVGEHGDVQLGNNEEEDSDEDSDEDDDFSGEDESMDDEAMMQLDDQLSEIFKRRKEALGSVPTGNKRKVEVQESRENVISFKHRVVDMLEIYVKSFDRAVARNNTSIITVEEWNNLSSIILPLLKCLQHTLDKALADKCAKLMKLRLCKVKATIAKEEKTVTSEIFHLLEKVHKLIMTAKPGQFQQLFFSTCSLASLFLSKLYLSSGGSHENLIDLYADTSKAWMKDGKCTVNFFIDFSNWLQTKRAA